MELSSWVGLSGVPVCIGLTQVLKQRVTDERWYPYISLAVGVVWNVALAAILKTDLATAAMIGIVVGLASSGLYSTGHAPLKRR